MEVKEFIQETQSKRKGGGGSTRNAEQEKESREGRGVIRKGVACKSRVCVSDQQSE